MVSHFELQWQAVVGVLAVAIAIAIAAGIAAGIVVDTAVAEAFDMHPVSVAERSFQLLIRE